MSIGSYTMNSEPTARDSGKPINILLTFDICTHFHVIRHAIPIINSLVETCSDELGTSIRKTWFVRCDNQLNGEYGSYTYLFTEYSSIWHQLERRGDEIAWHPHIYRPASNGWILETRDEQCRKHLVDSFDQLRRVRKIHAARIGESFQSNCIMATLNSLQIEVDSTAYPGRSRDDPDRIFDWIGTPQAPYHPSKEDYRVPGEPHHSLLEVPMSMVNIQTPYDTQPLARYVNLSFYNHLLVPDLTRVIRESDLLVSITHPFEIVSGIEPPHGLVSFSQDQFRMNLQSIVSICRSLNRPMKFITMKEVPGIYHHGYREFGN